MKFIFSFLLSLLMFNVYAQTIINDKNAEIRDIVAFSGLRVSGGFDVYLSQDSQTGLAVSATDQKLRDNIKTEVINGILVISYEGGSLNFRGQKNLRVYISFPDLESIEASGACNINIQQMLTSEALRLKLSGACEIKGKLNIQDMDVVITGASTSRLEGNVGNLKLKASGASDMKNYQLQVQNLVGDISGASDVKLTVENSISVRASGASNLMYSGSPQKVEVQASGASSATRKN